MKDLWEALEKIRQGVGGNPCRVSMSHALAPLNGLHITIEWRGEPDYSLREIIVQKDILEVRDEVDLLDDFIRRAKASRSSLLADGDAGVLSRHYKPIR